MLVVWIAACVARFFTTKYGNITIISEYSSALNWKALRNLVLSDKLAVDAAMYVAAYLRKIDKAATKSHVFSLHNEDATIDFARHYSKLSPKLF